VAGVAVAEQLERYCAGRVKLKWPNDILLTGKKVCGILAEMKTAADSIDFVIIGIGLNVNMQLHQFPVEIQTIATSLREVIGYEIPRQELIIGIYENMTKWYKQFLEDGFEPIRKKWLEYSAMAGQRVQVVFRDKKICGEALGIDEQGSLILLDKNGKTIKVSAGDATILKE
jgi:BirA family biotin operon repressor/biotin-[acetyl-CoA-carboxylase] ligase